MTLGSKVAVITGGGSGIGLATAQLFHACGARVAVLVRDPARVDETARAIGENSLVVAGDVRDVTSLRAFYRTVGQRWDRVDYVVANAGLAHPRPLTQCDEAYFDEMCGVNFRGVFFTVQSALELLQDGGAVVLVSSAFHSKGASGFSVYGATKSAVRALARSMAAELAPRNIRVNCVSPGVTETPIFGKLGMDDAGLVAFRQFVRSITPLDRVSRPEETAKAILFLCTDATFMTGADLVHDGGLSQV